MVFHLQQCFPEALVNKSPTLLEDLMEGFPMSLAVLYHFKGSL